MSSSKPLEKTAGRIGRKLKVIYEEVDKITSRGHAEFATTCKRGCNHCCHLAVMMTIPEALLIMDHLSREVMHWHWFESKIPQLRKWTEVLEDRETTREMWFDSQIPCFFLSNEECSIYNMRPVACRSHISTDDPFKCSIESARDQSVRFLNLQHVDNYVWSETIRWMAREKLPLGYAPMPTVLLWAYIYWTEGRRGFLKAIEGTALGDGDQTNILAWVHLARSDPRLTDVIDQMMGRS